MFCSRKYIPEPKEQGYPHTVRQRALQLYVDGVNLRRNERILGLHHRTVSLWVKASAARLPVAPVPEEVKTAEMDELFTFIGNKKSHLHPHARRSADPL
jgi:transposase-like protein